MSLIIVPSLFRRLLQIYWYEPSKGDHILSSCGVGSTDTLSIYDSFLIKWRWGQTCPKLFFTAVFRLFCPVASNWLWLDRTSAQSMSMKQYHEAAINVLFVCLFPIWCLKWKTRGKTLVFLSLISYTKSKKGWLLVWFEYFDPEINHVISVFHPEGTWHEEWRLLSGFLILFFLKAAG